MKFNFFSQFSVLGFFYIFILVCVWIDDIDNWFW